MPRTHRGPAPGEGHVVLVAGLVVLGEVQGHLDGVLHVEEVAHLFAVFVVRPVALEQPDLSGVYDLGVGLVHQAAHVPLMVLVRPVDIEVLQADQVVEDPLPLSPDINRKGLYLQL